MFTVYGHSIKYMLLWLHNILVPTLDRDVLNKHLLFYGKLLLLFPTFINVKTRIYLLIKYMYYVPIKDVWTLLPQPIFYFFSKFWIAFLMANYFCYFQRSLTSKLSQNYNLFKCEIYVPIQAVWTLLSQPFFLLFFSKHAFNLSLFCISSFANFPLQCKCRFWLNSAWVPSSQLECNAVVGKILSPKPEFVKEWVAKSQKILFTFADFSHRSWSYVGILPKD